jgi:hypothetical protein
MWGAIVIGGAAVGGAVFMMRELQRYNGMCAMAWNQSLTRDAPPRVAVEIQNVGQRIVYIDHVDFVDARGLRRSHFTSYTSLVRGDREYLPCTPATPSVSQARDGAAFAPDAVLDLGSPVMNTDTEEALSIDPSEWQREIIDYVKRHQLAVRVEYRVATRGPLSLFRYTQDYPIATSFIDETKK